MSQKTSDSYITTKALRSICLPLLNCILCFWSCSIQMTCEHKKVLNMLCTKCTMEVRACWFQQLLPNSSPFFLLNDQHNGETKRREKCSSRWNVFNYSTYKKKKPTLNLGKWKFKHYLTKMTSYYFCQINTHSSTSSYMARS